MVKPPSAIAGFTATRWSQVVLAGGDSGASRAALDWLCRAYWEPLRAHAARRGWREAEDAVQDFWLRLLEKGAIAQADSTRGRFRTWLLACLDHHLADRHEARSAAKRGGGQIAAELDETSAHARDAEPTLAFDRAWATTLVARVRDRLARDQEGEDGQRFARLEVFLTTNGDAAAYSAAATGLGLSEGAVKVAVHRLRRRFRALLRDEVAQTLAEPTPADIDAELGELLRLLTPL